MSTEPRSGMSPDQRRHGIVRTTKTRRLDRGKGGGRKLYCSTCNRWIARLERIIDTPFFKFGFKVVPRGPRQEVVLTGSSTVDDPRIVVPIPVKCRCGAVTVFDDRSGSEIAPVTPPL